MSASITSCTASGIELLNPTKSVSVVIPCFQQARFLAAAIDSVLAQQVPASEIIVVDDGSDDNPAAVTSRYLGVRLITQPNRGLAAARNAGLQAAAGDKVIFLDADDRLLPQAISAGLRCFAAHLDAAFVYGAYREVKGGSEVDRLRRAEGRCDLIRSNAVGMIGAVMFDRRLLLEVGGFEESLGMCEDWDAYLRLSRLGAFASHEAVVACYVKHAGNMSNRLKRLKHWIEVVRERERSRGLVGEEAAAWEEGVLAWERIYPTPSVSRRLASSARRIGELVAGGLRKAAAVARED